MADLGCRSVRRRSSLIRSAPDLFNTLNEELMIEVLKRLPLKEANRCKCVCKRWLDSISGAYFPRCYIKHRLCFPPSFALFFHYTDQGNWKVPVNLSGVQLANDVENHPVLNSPGFSLSFLPPSSQSSSQPVQFLGSSNGLVLCSTSIFWQKLYYVCATVLLFAMVRKLDRSEMVWEDPKLAKYATRCPYLLLVLAFHPIEGDVMFLSLPGHILEFNLRSRSLKLLCKLANRDACPHGTMFPYVLPWWPISVPQC